MDKPLSIKIINFILIAKLVIITLSFVLIILMLTVHSNDIHSYFYNFQEGALKSADLSRNDLGDENKIAEYLGKSTFYFISPLTIAILSIIFVKKRKFIASSVTFAIQLIFFSSNPFNLILNIILLMLLIINKKSFDRKTNESFFENIL